MIAEMTDRKAKLSSGRIVDYHACSENAFAYVGYRVKFIGEGVIHSVNGIKQAGDKKLYFFK